MVVPAGYPSFPCPSCGGALPATMAAGMKIPCPLCQRQITVPLGGGPSSAAAAQYQGWALQHGNTAAALSDAQSATGAGRTFASTSRPVLVDDGAGGSLLIGAQVSPQHGWWLRAIDLRSRAVRWDSLTGSSFQTCPGWPQICGRGGRVYVTHQGTVTAIDAASGAMLWSTPLGDEVETQSDRAARFGDEVELDLAGDVVVLRTKQDQLWGLDARTGTARWRRAAERSVRVHGGAILIEENDGSVELIRAADAVAICRFAAGTWRHGALLDAGLLVGAEEYGDDEVEGVVLVDAATGAQRWFTAGADLEIEDAVQVGHDIVCVHQVDGLALVKIPVTGGAVVKKGFFARLFGGGGGSAGPAAVKLPWPGHHHVDQMWAAGGALVLSASGPDGEHRFAVIDPTTLALRHDSGLVPSGSTPGARLAGDLLVYSFADSNGPHTVRAVSITTGALLWSRELADLDELAFRGGALAMICGGWVEAVEPSTGRVIATFQE